jgi:hypothetical protein
VNVGAIKALVAGVESLGKLLVLVLIDCCRLRVVTRLGLATTQGSHTEDTRAAVCAPVAPKHARDAQNNEETLFVGSACTFQYNGLTLRDLEGDCGGHVQARFSIAHKMPRLHMQAHVICRNAWLARHMRVYITCLR